jgi:hypothetical protein
MRAKKPDLLSGFNGLAVGRDGVPDLKLAPPGASVLLSIGLFGSITAS